MKKLNKIRAIRDPIYYMENVLKILTKSATLTNMELWDPQRMLIEGALKEYEERGYVRDVILKARQMGITTAIGGLLFHQSANKYYTSTHITAHKQDPSTEIFDMYNRFYDHLPTDFKPATTYSNRKELIFSKPKPRRTGPDDTGLNSKLAVSTAGSKDFARAPTIHNLHWSEVAFTKNARAIDYVLLSAVPKPPDASFVFYESTANGTTGLFHDLFWDAKRGKNDWNAIFLPWFIHKGYRMKAPPGFALSRKEYSLKARFNLDNEQLMFRRWTILNDMKGNEEKFEIEYPSTPEEAFKGSLESLFDSKVLDKMDTTTCRPIAYVYPNDTGLSTSQAGAYSTNPAFIWEFPDGKSTYVAGIDAAGGKTTGDSMVLEIFKLGNPIKLVATYADKCELTQFGKTCAVLLSHYNHAFVCPERNTHGSAVIVSLNEHGYKRMYVADDGQFGIQVTGSNQCKLVDKLASMIHREELEIHDDRIITALKNYQEVNGRFFGPKDDFVDALRMATWVANITTGPREEEKEVVTKSWRGWSLEDWDNYGEANKNREEY